MISETEKFQEGHLQRIITNGRENQISIDSQKLTNKFQYKTNTRYMYMRQVPQLGY